MRPAASAANTFDVAVAGGGPAGAAVACRLVALGYRVVLVAAGRPAGEDRTETLPPSIATLDGVLPLAPALAHAQAASSTRLNWTGVGMESRLQPGTLLVRRSAFDAGLLHAARDAGAVVIAPARVRRPGRTADGWCVPVQTATGALTINARFFVDAAGRNGRLGLRAERFGPATVALSACWTGVAVEPGVVMVEARPDAWCWGVAATDGVLQVTAFVEMASCAGQGRAALRARLVGLLRASQLFAAASGGGRAGPLRICDATPLVTYGSAGPDALRIGDAAFAPDPLSSQGVQCALRSGVQSAAVIHTHLSGGDAQAAVEFYEAAIRQLVSRHSNAAAQLYAEHQAWAETPFWKARTEALHASSEIAAPESELARDALIRLSPTATVGLHPALFGCVICRVPAVTGRPGAAPMAWVGSLHLPPLLKHLEAVRRACDVLASWSSAMPQDQAKRLLRELLDERILVTL